MKLECKHPGGTVINLQSGFDLNHIKYLRAAFLKQNDLFSRV